MAMNTGHCPYGRWVVDPTDDDSLPDERQAGAWDLRAAMLALVL